MLLSLYFTSGLWKLSFHSYPKMILLAMLLEGRRKFHINFNDFLFKKIRLIF